MRIPVAAALLALAACTPSGDGAAPAKADSHLDCAALISAADHMMADGRLAPDKDMQSKVLVSAMTHLNAYAIPQGIAEKDAFAAVDARRDELMASTAPEEILSRAKACVAKTPRT
ncbi:MAG: hypothetical protein R3C00_09180 [Hyphomonas sp.]|nr:hypothetical protein [Hyphomonas sp.]MCA8906030.1 hypothetical protein [Hyphomonas sp.]MCB9970715.1 hypothetical protein [Hyphomonas sp.]